MVKNLCKSIVTRLENQKAIALQTKLREIVRDDVYSLVGPYILTDQDIRERTLEKIGASKEQMEENLTEQQLLESAPYRTARSLVRKALGDDELNGFYFQKSLNEIARLIGDYLMRSSHIEDVFETDDDLIQITVDIIKHFNPGHAH